MHTSTKSAGICVVHSFGPRHLLIALLRKVFRVNTNLVGTTARPQKLSTHSKHSKLHTHTGQNGKIVAVQRTHSSTTDTSTWDHTAASIQPRLPLYAMDYAALASHVKTTHLSAARPCVCDPRANLSRPKRQQVASKRQSRKWLFIYHCPIAPSRTLNLKCSRLKQRVHHNNSNRDCIYIQLKVLLS